MSEEDVAESIALPSGDATVRKPTLALALGAGGAKGLAHIGVIEELEAQGFEIVAIAGTSMGAVIGGIHATGKLDLYRDWVTTLDRLDVLRLVDWTFSGGGLIKGDRIIHRMLELIGDELIENLPIAFTAVATDIDREREVWLTRGSLFEAIRASIAIPTLFRPYLADDRRLVDGALLNPVPITPLIREPADYLFAVSLDGPVTRSSMPEPDESAGPRRKGISRLIGQLIPHGTTKRSQPGAFELMTLSIDLMQATLSRMRLAAHEPDLLIRLPRNVSSSFEFHRASELIERGRDHAREALREWKTLHGDSPRE